MNIATDVLKTLIPKGFKVKKYVVAEVAQVELH